LAVPLLQVCSLLSLSNARGCIKMHQVLCKFFLERNNYHGK